MVAIAKLDSFINYEAIVTKCVLNSIREQNDFSFYLYFIAYHRMTVVLKSSLGEDYFCVKENCVPQVGLLL